ncbi:hypothetical protein L211DRAFT_868716 [Terfezia boudieri ATCC MYA-4762]|uniref:ATP-dependent RNA helicase DHX8 n=1 Tax=Terfezia boudieri ATCC MYA-4762 TaxID=1051890 RepID=A0A3N4LK22_9PEZI|nr:hypothetical protein L211DRAFT_868716 [Terfezia boudieri ATCC MYA-4762]
MPQSIIPPAYRQIRAVYDDETITVYQAYNSEIAIPAVAQQSLTASPAFQLDRMTWVKPSFMWMMYRSGYSYKEPRQAHILAIKITRQSFEALLRQSSVKEGRALTSEEKSNSVRIQWDPERSIRIEKLPYRSIQIGIGSKICSQYLSGIVEIQDITETARKLKSLLDEEKDEDAKLLLPTEKVYPLPEELRSSLKMDVVDECLV